MTLEEAENLKPGDQVTRNGEAGTVQVLSNGVSIGQGLMVSVKWASGRQGTVEYLGLEPATPAATPPGRSGSAASASSPSTKGQGNDRRGS